MERILNSRGLSVMELLVTVTVMMLLFAIGNFNLSELTRTFSRSSALDQIQFDLRRARAEALGRGVRTVLLIDSSGTSYTVGYDLLPYNDDAEADENIFTGSFPSPVRLVATDPIIFDSRGYLVDNDSLPTSVNIAVLDGASAYCYGTIASVGTMTVTC